MKIVIYGSKVFAATVKELLNHCGHQLEGMVDDFNKAPGILGNLEEVVRRFSPDTHGFAIGIGYNNLAARWAAWNRIKTLGYKAPFLVHPRAYVADSATIGEGAMIMAGAIIDVRTRVDDLAVVWPGACVNHDSHVGSNTFVSPNATIGGCCLIGSHSFIGAGSVVVNHSNVPQNSFIKVLGQFYKE